jgi:DNA-binding CsgD family transcriptional regulator
VARCRGLIAADADFTKAFEHALALCDANILPLERARTLLSYGQRLRRAKRRRDAREHLYAALALFDTAGATGWARQCRTEINATGQHTAPRDGGAVEQLTNQEWQIALGAADGLTNREIATRVFLSPKTVDYHLGHIYRKLSLSSRHDLIRYLSPRTNATTTGTTVAS